MSPHPGYDATQPENDSNRAGLMTTKAAHLLIGMILISFTAGCRSVDPAAKFMAQMDHAPVEHRPKDWDRTKTLMARPVPVVGQPAPDFGAQSLDGSQTIVRSVHQAGRPLVLIFGSFT